MLLYSAFVFICYRWFPVIFRYCGSKIHILEQARFLQKFAIVYQNYEQLIFHKCYSVLFICVWLYTFSKSSWCFVINDNFSQKHFYFKTECKNKCKKVFLKLLLYIKYCDRQSKDMRVSGNKFKYIKHNSVPLKVQLGKFTHSLAKIIYWIPIT